MSLTLSEQQARLILYQNAEARALTGQSYNIEGESVVRPDLDTIQKTITQISEEITRLSRPNPSRGLIRGSSTGWGG